MKYQFQYVQANRVYSELKNSAPIHLIDVRSHGEFADGHAKGSKSIPLDELDIGSLKDKTGSQEMQDQTIYLLCQSGVRAEQAAARLQHLGLKNMAIVQGGTDEWRSNNLPMVRTSRLPSLERQTQIAIGVLLLLMLFKGFVLHPIFYALIALLALGLITAGVTARCTLTALLAKMPWNQPHCNSTV